MRVRGGGIWCYSTILLKRTPFERDSSKIYGHKIKILRGQTCHSISRKSSYLVLVSFIYLFLVYRKTEHKERMMEKMFFSVVFFLLTEHWQLMVNMLLNRYYPEDSLLLHLSPVSLGHMFTWVCTRVCVTDMELMNIIQAFAESPNFNIDVWGQGSSFKS